MDRFIGELLSPKVPWVELLRSFLREQVNDDYDFMKPDLLMSGGDFIAPSLYSEGVGSVVFAVDTSGSIDHDMLKTFKSEMQGCLDDMRPTKLLELCCDTKITAERTYNRGDAVLPDAPGGGGTSFKPVFSRLEQEHTAPKCVVYLTDLDGTFPEQEPGYPVLWVTYSARGKKAPFGETVEAD
jgi:predicted metal-dependent peptidase